MSLYHVRYSIEFEREEYAITAIYNEFRSNMINNHHAVFTLDATFYIFSHLHIDELINRIILLEFNSVVSSNNINPSYVTIKYDVCILSDPVTKRIRL